MTPKVLNIRRAGWPDGAVDVTRLSGSPFGNPFCLGRDGGRAQVLAKFEAFVAKHPELVERAKRELRGKDLLCWCAPKKCHADVWLRIAND
jgi:hypothetical protein